MARPTDGCGRRRWAWRSPTRSPDRRGEDVDRPIADLIVCNGCGRRPRGFTEFATHGWACILPAELEGYMDRRRDPEEFERLARGRIVALCPDCVPQV